MLSDVIYITLCIIAAFGVASIVKLRYLLCFSWLSSIFLSVLSPFSLAAIIYMMLRDTGAGRVAGNSILAKIVRHGLIIKVILPLLPMLHTAAIYLLAEVTYEAMHSRQKSPDYNTICGELKYAITSIGK